jgi:anti-anti-sigma factor
MVNGMLVVNVDTVGEAAIVECAGMIMDNDDAVQLRDAITGRASIRVVVIDLSKVSVTGEIGLGILLSLQRWARHCGIQLKLFNPRSSVRRDLEYASSEFDLEFASLGEVMALVIDAGYHQPLAA